jgi:predicted DNA-binding transcriptional regulator AlpA
MQQRYIRLAELASTPKVAGRWPVSPATVWRWVKAGILPNPVRLGPQVVAWPIEVIEAHETATTGMAYVVNTVAKQRAAAKSVEVRRAKRAMEAINETA